jgi:hypothetical protein
VSAFGVPVVGEFIATAVLARLKEDAAPAGVAGAGRQPCLEVARRAPAMS